MPPVSVIIPCFNVEDFVLQAVNSVLDQSLRNSEIIIIDDGSTDGTSKLIQLLSEQDKRIKIITKANEGLSSARNAGAAVQRPDAGSAGTLPRLV